MQMHLLLSKATTGCLDVVLLTPIQDSAVKHAKLTMCSCRHLPDTD